MITELEKKIIADNAISYDSWVVNAKPEFILPKVRNCLKDLKSKWVSVLEEKGLTIPEDDYEFAELVFAQPEYKSRAQRDVKTPEELLQEAKDIKLIELETIYAQFQWIRVINGHTFMIPLSGEGFKQVSNQANAAKINGSASLRWPDIDGNIRTLFNIPLSEWLKFFSPAKSISEINYFSKEDKILQINACLTSSALNAVDINIFPPIIEVQIDI